MDEPAPRPTRPILLVGMPGSGKSTIGPLLAARLGVPFRDSDAMIEQRLGLGIAEIFTRHGEGHFRSEERNLLAELIAAPPAVIAAGGGAFVDPDIRALANEQAIAVWLDTDLGTLEHRLGDTADRPLLAGEGALAALKASRDPLYSGARIQVDSTPPPDRVVATIIDALAEPAR